MATLGKLSEELERATLESMKVAEASRQEREKLVKAALSSLAQMRRHLIETLSGIREQDGHATPDALPVRTEPGLDQFKWHKSKHRWGLGRSNKTDVSVVVHLGVPSQLVSPRQSTLTASPLARTPNVPSRPRSAVAVPPASARMGLARPPSPRVSLLASAIGQHQAAQASDALAPPRPCTARLPSPSHQVRRIQIVDRIHPPPLQQANSANLLQSSALVLHS